MEGARARSWFGATLQGRRLLVERRIDAVQRNDPEELESLLDYQGSPKSKELTSALEMALLKRSDCYAKCVELLLKKGANVNGRNGYGTPFIVLAAESGCLDILHLLISANCRLDQRREDGATALHRAAANGHIHCVRVLIDAGLDPNLGDRQNRTALFFATEENNNQMLQQLVDCKANVNVADFNGTCPLHIASKKNYIDTVQYMLENGALLNMQDVDFNESALMIAAKNGYMDICELLVNNGADLNLKNVHNDSALLLAAESEHIDCACLLIRAGADVTIEDDSGAVILMYVVDKEDLLETLLNKGACPDIRTHNSITTLWLACTFNFEVSVKLLLQANCDFWSPVGEENIPPLQLTLENFYITISKLLFFTSLLAGVDLKWFYQYLEHPDVQLRTRNSRSLNSFVLWTEERRRELPPVPTLFQLCRRTIRASVGNVQVVHKIDSMPLPNSLKDYLKLVELDHLLDEDLETDE